MRVAKKKTAKMHDEFSGTETPFISLHFSNTFFRSSIVAL